MRTNQLTKGEISWQVIIFIAVTITALEAPFSFTFKTRLQNWQVVLDVLISSIFLSDVIYQLRQKRKGRVSLKNTEEKTKWWTLLIIDGLCSIPFELISFMLGVSATTRLLNLLRLFRMVRIFRLLQFIGKLTVVPRKLKTAILFFCFVIAVHWISCAWLKVEVVTGIDRADIYIKALYWTVTTLTTIGYGDITPTSMYGRIFTMVIMILGVGVYGIVIGNVTRMIAAGERYKEQAREKMNDVMNFMKYYNIPDRLQHNVLSYYNNVFNKRLTDNDNKIINDLPQALQQELQIYMNIKLIRTLPLFRNCTQQCLRDVSAALKQKFFGPGQTIINIGELGDEMYIIAHGIVEVILSDGNVVASLHEGQFFGEAALLKETKRNANVRAQNYCDVYKLEKNDFLKIIENHPDLLESIESVSSRRASDRK